MSLSKKKNKRTGTWKLLRKLALPKFLSLHKKSELPKIWEGKGGLAAPAPPARALMGAMTCFFNQTHLSFR